MYILTTWWGKKICSGTHNKVLNAKWDRNSINFRMYEIIDGQAIFITGRV